MPTSARSWAGTPSGRSASSLCLLLLAALGPRAAAGTTWRDDTPERLRRFQFEGLPWKRDCWLYTPRNCDKARRYPLVVVLHPAGLRGLTYAKIWGKTADRTGEFLVLAPECRDEKRRTWTMGDEALVVRTLDRAVKAFPHIDSTRVLLTGFSLGGNYAYLFGLRNPAKFRAVAVASAVLKARPSPQGDAILQRARHLPVYIVHGARDPHVPFQRARASRDRLEHFGFHVTYTEHPYLAHFYPPMESDRIWAWFKKAIARPGVKSGTARE